MGLFGSILGGVKSVGKKLLGGGGPKSYASPYVGSYEEGARAGISNRLGARSYKDAQGKTQYDYSGVGRPVTKDQAVAGYDFSPVSEAMASYRNPNKLTQTYKPSLFNFQGLPDEYGNKAYELGSKSVRDEGNASLEKIREATGTRRPGLLMKAAQDSQRNVADALAGLRGNIDLDVMKQKTDLGVRQQEAQAGENYKGYQSQADLEKSNADEAFRNAQALGQTGLNKISAENTITENERAYNDQALEYLMNLLSSTAGFNQNASAQGTSKRNSTLGFLGDLAKAGATVATLCLPKGTLIEVDGSDPVQVESIKIGDLVKGGRVIAIGQRERPVGHNFYKQVFDTGEVVMSLGHPFFDKLRHVEIDSNDSPNTYDILTDSGYYFVNKVKLGSTLR